ncbi:transposase domain-containing protein [Streptomyces sp. NPDC001537]
MVDEALAATKTTQSRPRALPAHVVVYCCWPPVCFVNDPGLKSRACATSTTGCGAAFASCLTPRFRGWAWGG